MLRSTNKLLNSLNYDTMSHIIPSLENVEDCIVFAENINTKKEPLTIEKLRTFPGCEHYSDEEALGIVQTIEQLAIILFKSIQKPPTCIDNQQVVYLEKNTGSEIIPIESHKTKTVAA